MTGMLRGRERQSKMIGFCTQGMRKWVPSPTTVSWTPRNRSKITALCPASTAKENIVSVLSQVISAQHQNFHRNSPWQLVKAFCCVKLVKIFIFLGATNQKRYSSTTLDPSACSQETVFLRKVCSPPTYAMHEVQNSPERLHNSFPQIPLATKVQSNHRPWQKGYKENWKRSACPTHHCIEQNWQLHLQQPAPGRTSQCFQTLWRPFHTCSSSPFKKYLLQKSTTSIKPYKTRKPGSPARVHLQTWEVSLLQKTRPAVGAIITTALSLPHSSHTGLPPPHHAASPWALSPRPRSSPCSSSSPLPQLPPPLRTPRGTPHLEPTLSASHVPVLPTALLPSTLSETADSQDRGLVNGGPAPTRRSQRSSQKPETLHPLPPRSPPAAPLTSTWIHGRPPYRACVLRQDARSPLVHASSRHSGTCSSSLPFQLPGGTQLPASSAVARLLSKTASHWLLLLLPATAVRWQKWGTAVWGSGVDQDGGGGLEASRGYPTCSDILEAS